MSIFVISVIISLVMFFVVGNIVGRKVKSIDDYFVAGRKAPTVLIVGTVVASYASTTTFLGEVGFAYNGSPFLVWGIGGLMVFGSIAGVLFFGVYLRKSRALTVPAFFGERFDSKHVQRMAGLTTIFGVTLYMVAVMQGLALIFSELLGIEYWIALCVIWFVFTSFTMYSGSGGVLITDTMMFFIFTMAGLISSLYVFQTLGGWEEVMVKLSTLTGKEGIISWHGVMGSDLYIKNVPHAITWFVTFGVVWAVVVSVSPWQSGRYLMAKNQYVAIRAGLFSALVLVSFSMFIMPMGAAINIINPDIVDSEKAMIWLSVNYLPMILGILSITGIFAAGLSSCSTFLSLIGFSLSNDLFTSSNTSEEKALLYSRLAMLLAGLVALVLAIFRPSAVMSLAYFAATLFASSWGPVAFLSVWNKNISSTAAYLSIFVGFVANLGAAVLNDMGVISLPLYLDPFVIGVVLALLTIFIVSKFTVPTEKALAYYHMLHQKSDELSAEEEKLESNKTIRAAYLVIGLIILGTAYIVYNYAMNLFNIYDRQFTVETIGGFGLSILFSISIIAGSLITIKVVKKS